MNPTTRRTVALAPVALVLAGCAVFEAQHSRRMYAPAPVAAEPAEPAPPAPLPVPASATPPAVAAEPSLFGRVQSEIFTPKCAIPECHVTPPAGSEDGPPGALILEKGKSFEMTVGVRAREVELARVEPGRPDDSYLLRKVTPDAKIAWHRMPLERPPLSDAERALLREWIAGGAKGD